MHREEEEGEEANEVVECESKHTCDYGSLFTGDQIYDNFSKGMECRVCWIGLLALAALLCGAQAKTCGMWAIYYLGHLTKSH